MENPALELRLFSKYSPTETPFWSNLTVRRTAALILWSSEQGEKSVVPVNCHVAPTTCASALQPLKSVSSCPDAPLRMADGLRDSFGTRRGAILERLEVVVVGGGRLLVVDVRVEHLHGLDEGRAVDVFPRFCWL